MVCRITLVLLLAGGVARADHHDMVMTGEAPPTSSFGAGLSVLAAEYGTKFYVGDYQGVMPALRWARDTLAVGISLPYYRLYANGYAQRGLGDLVLSGQAALVRGRDVQGGLVLGISAPTGDQATGFGMGHPMVMPAAWSAWTHARLTWTVALGYSRALADAGAHDHGLWPIVEPMNMAEVTWNGGTELMLSPRLHAGARLSGGVPVGAPGDTRVVGSVRLAWSQGRMETSGELQAGLAGDPFIIRGVVSSTLRF